MAVLKSKNESPIQDTSFVSPISLNGVLRLTYMWMFMGLVLTAGIAIFTFNTFFTPVVDDSTGLLFYDPSISPFVFIGALIAQFIMVLVLVAAINRLAPGLALAIFFVYAGLMGFSLSGIFAMYDIGDISAAFISASGMFIVMSAVGFVTKVDLSKYSTIFFMALIGIVIAMVVNIFLQSSAFEFLISIGGVILFAGLTAWDTQKIKNMAQNPEIAADHTATMRVSIYGALSLYLDFINLFLFLLRIFGRNN
jgi:uncharacterized protein